MEPDYETAQSRLISFSEVRPMLISIRQLAAVAGMLLVSTSVASAQTLTGQVFDYGMSQLGGVTVSLRTMDDRKLADDVLSGADGTYRFDRVAATKVKLSLIKSGYVDAPTITTATMQSGMGKAPDVRLYNNRTQSITYFTSAATHFRDHVRKQDTTPVALAEEWAYMTTAHVSLPFKWRLTGGLNEVDRDLVASVPLLRAYQSTKLETVEALESLCLETARLAPDATSKLADFAGRQRVPQSVLRDALISTLISPDLDGERREAFGIRIRETGAFNSVGDPALMERVRFEDLSRSPDFFESGDERTRMIRLYEALFFAPSK